MKRKVEKNHYQGENKMKISKNRSALVVLIVMTVSVALAFSACGKKEKSALEIFKAASKNIQNAKDAKIEGGKMTAALDLSGQKMEVNADINGQFIKSKTDNPLDFQGVMELTMNIAGTSNKTKAYVKDGTIYQESTTAAGTTKTKSPLGITKEDLKQLTEESGDMKIDDFVKEDSKDGDNIKLTLDAKKYIEKAMEKVNAKQSKGFDKAKVEKQIKGLGIKDVLIETKVKDEKFESIKYTLEINMDGSALMGGTAGKATGGNNKIGVKITVDFPKITVDSGEEIQFPNFKDFKKAPAAPAQKTSPLL